MMALLPIILFVTIEMYSNDEKTDANGITIKNTSAVARLCRQQTYSQKFFVFSQFHLTKRMTFMSKFTKLHS
jgi:hypothetical protein